MVNRRLPFRPWEQAIQLGSNDTKVAITYWALGTCQLLLGRVDQAIGLLQTARAADTRLWVPYFYLAGAYGLQGDLDQARSALAESIRLKPAIKSLDRMLVENAWLSNTQYWALQEKTLNLGLRRRDYPIIDWLLQCHRKRRSLVAVSDTERSPESALRVVPVAGGLLLFGARRFSGSQ